MVICISPAGVCICSLWPATWPGGTVTVIFCISGCAAGCAACTGDPMGTLLLAGVASAAVFTVFVVVVMGDVV